ncbi:Capsular polysaccharide synthesis enzyme Cap5M [Staphylococcus aureus]|nr:Capsular polysaccharide synthesis enzyme Cap5M [Staphylococcus aureus]
MKRLFDVVSSIYGLVVLSPILLITALLIKMEHPDQPFSNKKDRRLIMNCLIFISLDQ